MLRKKSLDEVSSKWNQLEAKLLKEMCFWK